MLEIVQGQKHIRGQLSQSVVVEKPAENNTIYATKLTYSLFSEIIACKSGWFSDEVLVICQFCTERTELVLDSKDAFPQHIGPIQKGSAFAVAAETAVAEPTQCVVRSMCYRLFRNTCREQQDHGHLIGD